YLDRLSWEDGVAEVIRREARGIRDIEEVYGQRPLAYVKPGYSWGPPVPEAMRQMGVPFLADAPFEWAPGEPMWYQNMLALSYHHSFDEYFGRPNRLERMKADFERRCSQFNGRTMVMYTHPCRLMTAEFWDAANFRAGQNMPRDHWKPAKLLPESEVADLQRDFDAFLGWVVKRGDVRITT